jgi:hypothetical protein
MIIELVFQVTLNFTFDMNIFYLDSNPKVCAEMHNDKHCIKMILEYAQLLSTAHRVLDGTINVGLSASGRKKTSYVLVGDLDSVLYSATHINHPSAIWVRKSVQNYMWLAELLEMLCGEYTYRYGKVHKVERDGLMQTLKNNFPKNIYHDVFWSEPTPAMPDDVKIAGDSIASYRNYYISNKQHLASWQGKINSRPVPNWFQTA